MANVSFKRGPAANLAAAGFSAKDGVFYLTTDTHRLYVGQGDGNLVDLNRYIQYVNDASELAGVHTIGDFAFNADGNQLLVYNGSTWAQINPDTNDDTSVTAISTPIVTSDKTGVTVSFNLQQSTLKDNGDTVAKADIPVSFKITAADFATANEVAVGIKAETVDNGAKVSVKGAGSDGSAINIKGGANVAVSVSGSDISIAATDTTYTLTGKDNAITLSDGSTNIPISVASGSKITATVENDTLTIAHAGLAQANKVIGENISLDEDSKFSVITGIAAADGHVTSYTVQEVTVPDYEDTKYHYKIANGANSAEVKLQGSTAGTETNMEIIGGTDAVVTGDAAGNTVTVAHKAYAAVTPVKDAEVEKLVDAGTFTVVKSVTTNNGHVTGIQTKDVKLPAQNDYSPKTVAVNADNTGSITVDVTDSEGNRASGSADNVLYMNVNGNKVYNQGSIEFYTKEQIDSKINGIDAMRYKGTVGGSGATVSDLPSTGVAIGDTYMVAMGGNYDGHDCEVGDLLIATGVETNGVITSGLAWTYVPSGDDTDTQFALQLADNVITLRNSTAQEDAGTVEIKGADKINVSTSDGAIIIKHAGLNAPKASESAAAAPSFGGSFTVLDSLTAADGHVTAYTTKKVILPTPDDTAGSIKVAEGHTIAYHDGEGDTNVVLKNDDYITLADDTANDTITIGHKAYAVPLAATSAGETKKLEASGKFTVVTGVSRDKGGHLDGFTTQEFALPVDNNTTYTITSTDEATIKMTGSDSSAPEVAFFAGTATNVTGNSDGITIGHANVTNSKTAANAETLSNGGKFTVIKDVTVNAQGHTTAIKTVDITLPKLHDTQGAVAGSVNTVANGAEFVVKYSDDSSNESEAALAITSKSLTVTAGTNAVSIDLEWGSF